MGLFNTFGLFSSMMIILSLIASMVITTAAIGFVKTIDDSLSDDDTGLESETATD